MGSPCMLRLIVTLRDALWDASVVGGWKACTCVGVGDVCAFGVCLCSWKVFLCGGAHLCIGGKRAFEGGMSLYMVE